MKNLLVGAIASLLSLDAAILSEAAVVVADDVLVGVFWPLLAVVGEQLADVGAGDGATLAASVIEERRRQYSRYST